MFGASPPFVCIANNEDYDKRAVFGFIRRDYIQLHTFAEELIALISYWYVEGESTYLVQWNKEELWSININDIL